MKALLDTHALLWLVDNPARLPATVVSLCEEESNALFVSIASYWELAIKMALGKISLADDGLAQLKNWCDENAVQLLNIDVRHCEQVKILPFHHRDPFDRLLIAQAMTEKLALISGDTHFPNYQVEVVWN